MPEVYELSEDELESVVGGKCTTGGTYYVCSANKTHSVSMKDVKNGICSECGASITTLNAFTE